MSFSALVMVLVVGAGFIAILYSIFRLVVKSSTPAPAMHRAGPDTCPLLPEHLPDFFEKLSFFPSRKSALGKARRSLRITWGIWSVISLLIFNGNLAVAGWAIGIFTAIMLPVELWLRNRMKPGLPAVRLTSHAIESDSFSGKTKVLRWRDIASVAFTPIQGTPYLQFVLRDTAGLPNSRNFWTGANPAQPMLLLSSLSPEDQEALLGAISARLAHISGKSSSTVALDNEIRAEREFAEKLKSFAPHTWATYALVAANIGIWLWTLTAGASLLNTPAENLLHWGGNAASEVQRGEWWRLLNATFLHNGMMHVAMNMLGLFTAGVIVERVYGHRLFLLIYFGSGLIGSALSLHYSAQQAVSVGASGAVFGITGALLVGFLQHRDKLPKASSRQMISGVGFFVAYSLLQGFGKQGIDNAAHIGGLLGGCLLAYILPERFDLEHYRKTFAGRAAAALLASAIATMAIAIEAPPASVDQAKVFASTEYLKRGLARFDEYFKELKQLNDDAESGKISEWEADERGRRVYAPKFRMVVDDLAQVTLHPGDQRKELLADIKKISELMAESLAMKSVVQSGSAKPQPADPVRIAQIENELKALAGRMESHMKRLNKKK